MKKTIQLLALAALPLMGVAQKAKVQTAWRALNDYESTLSDKPDFDYLKKAKENIDLAVAHEDTKNQAKTYAYKCRIYANLFIYNLKTEEQKLDGTIKDENARLEMAYGNVSVSEFEEAGKSIEKIQQLDSKFIENLFKGEINSEDDSKFVALLNQLNTHQINLASGKYKVKKYDEAADFFISVAISNSIMTGKKDTMNFFNACLSAQKAKNYTKMIDYNKKMIDQKISSPYNYQTIYDAKLAQKDTVGALEYLKSGRKLFPNDVYLMNRETEIFLQKGQQDKALANLEAAILKEPNNAQLELVLGNVYDNLANPKGKSGKDTTKPADFDNLVMKAADHYKKAIDLKPSNQDSYFSALYNIGALYNNYGGYIQTQANNLPAAQAKIKGKELEAKSQENYKNAIPYLEQAHSIKADDKSCMIALRKLYLLTGNEANAKIMSDKLKGGK
jgi:hypothetical protein